MTDLVRQAREQLIRVGLLGDHSPGEVVPDLIVRSWRRSLGTGVDSDALCQRYSDIDTESMLYRAAEPVLDRWQGQLADTGTTLFLSDRAGSIVARRASDSSARRRLDRVHAAEGFDYSEESVGTNGLGTSMVEGRALLIAGSQHYNDALAGLACAAAPLFAPTGAVVGSISLGGPVEVANPLMLSLTREIGQQIEERLKGVARPQDLALAMSFMRFTNSRRPTVVMDAESLMANTPGLPYVDVTSHVMLWELLNSHDWSTGRPLRLQPDGTDVEVTARRVLDGARAHYVMHFAELERDTAAAAERPDKRRRRQTEISTSQALWASGLLLVDGPVGSGRATLAKDLHDQRRQGAALHEFTVDPTASTPWFEVASTLAGGADVLLRRVEHVPADEADQLRQLVAEHWDHVRAGQRSTVLVVTMNSDDAVQEIRSVVERTPPAAKTPALSETPERIPGLVKRILDRVDPAGRHTMSPAALQALVQYRWPGNISELVDVLTDAVARARGSVVERQHLPARLQQTPRRKMTLLESAEREAIFKALQAANGNKSEAAAVLGIGRTTLYRRIRQLGIDAGEDTL